MVSIISALLLASSLATPFQEVYVDAPKIGSTLIFGNMRMTKTGKPPGVWRVTFRGKPWSSGEEMDGIFDFVVSTARARILVIGGHELVCKSFSGRRLWWRELPGDDPGGLVLNSDVVVCSIGVNLAHKSLGYSSETDMLNDWYASANEVVACKLGTGSQIWCQKTLAVGVPIAPGVNRTYLALRLQDPLKMIAPNHRQFWLDVRSLDSGRRLASFRIPKAATERTVEEYLLGMSCIDAKRQTGETVYVLKKRRWEFQGEHLTTLVLNLQDNLHKATFRIGRRLWSSASTR